MFFDVRLYCFRSDTQFQCYLFVRSALADLLENVALARTQRLRNGRSRVCGQIRLMDFRDLLYSVQERVASICFNRPRSPNALTTGMLGEISDANNA